MNLLANHFPNCCDVEDQSLVRSGFAFPPSALDPLELSVGRKSLTRHAHYVRGGRAVSSEGDVLRRAIIGLREAFRAGRIRTLTLLNSRTSRCVTTACADGVTGHQSQSPVSLSWKVCARFYTNGLRRTQRGGGPESRLRLNTAAPMGRYTEWNLANLLCPLWDVREEGTRERRIGVVLHGHCLFLSGAHSVFIPTQ